MRDQFFIAASLSLLVVSGALAYFLVVIQPNQKGSTSFEKCYNTCTNIGVPPSGGQCADGRILGELNKDIGTEYKKGDPWCYTNEGYCFSTCNK